MFPMRQSLVSPHAGHSTLRPSRVTHCRPPDVEHALAGLELSLYICADGVFLAVPSTLFPCLDAARRHGEVLPLPATPRETPNATLLLRVGAAIDARSYAELTPAEADSLFVIRGRTLELAVETHRHARFS